MKGRKRRMIGRKEKKHFRNRKHRHRPFEVVIKVFMGGSTR